MKGDGNYWCACVQCPEAFFGGKYDLVCPDCKRAASGIETEGHDREAGHGAKHESPTAESGDANV